MRKKFLAGLLATVMMVCIAGCGNAEKGSTETTKSVSSVAGETVKTTEAGEEISFPLKEEVTFTISGPYNPGNTADWESTVQFKEYKKRLGINLKASTYDNETWETQFTLMLAEDKLPDIIAGASVTPSDMAKYAKEGYFLDFSKHLDKMPNLTAFFEKHPEYKAAVSFDDGGIYGFSAMYDWCDSAFSCPAYMNQSWLDRLGLERPETLDDLYDVLKAFKEQDANGNGDTTDEIPMSMKSSNRMNSISPILWAYGIFSGETPVWWEQVDENGKVQLMDASENAKEFYKFVNKLYKEGLINQDVYSIEDSAYKELSKNNIGYLGGYQASVDLENHARNQWYLMGGLTTKEWNEKPVLVVRNKILPYYRVMVSADVENVDAVVAFIDYLFTEEGMLSTINGYEGVSFDFKDVCGFKAIDHTAYADGYESTEAYRVQAAVADAKLQIVGSMIGFWDMIEEIDEDKLLSDEVLEVASVNAVNEKAFRDGRYTVVYSFPSLKYSDEVAAEYATLKTDLTNYILTASAQFIVGEMDVDKDWDKYLAQLNEIGLPRLLEIEQEAYDSYIANY